MVTLSPTRPEGQMLFAYGMRQEITLSPTRPEGAEAHSPGRALKKSLHGLC